MIHSVLGELLLNCVPGITLDDRPVQTLICQPLVDHQTEVDWISQDEVEIAPCDRPAADCPAALRDTPMGADAFPVELICKRVHRAKFNITPEDQPHFFGFSLIDDQRAGLDLVAKRHAATHPHALLARSLECAP